MRTDDIKRLVVGLAAVVAAAAAGLSSAEAGSPAAAAATRATKVEAPAQTVTGPSGLPVPRFVALKKDEVRGRFGPGFDYPVAAIYKRRGLPVRVVAETRDDVWRRVEDADGKRVWVHRSMLMANDTVLVGEAGAVLRAKPDAAAAGRARLTGGVMAEVLSCDGAWCRVKAGEFKGWLEAAGLWGAPRG